MDTTRLGHHTLIGILLLLLLLLLLWRIVPRVVVWMVMGVRGVQDDGNGDLKPRAWRIVRGDDDRKGWSRSPSYGRGGRRNQDCSLWIHHMQGWDLNRHISKLLLLLLLLWVLRWVLRWMILKMRRNGRLGQRRELLWVG